MRHLFALLLLLLLASVAHAEPVSEPPPSIKMDTGLLRLDCEAGSPTYENEIVTCGADQLHLVCRHELTVTPVADVGLVFECTDGGRRAILGD